MDKDNLEHFGKKQGCSWLVIMMFTIGWKDVHDWLYRCSRLNKDNLELSGRKQECSHLVIKMFTIG